MTRITLVGLAITTVGLAACSNFPGMAPPAGTSEARQTATRTGASNASALTVADQAFLTQAAYGGLAEVALGKVADQRAADTSVRQIAREMMDHHAKANQELVALAKTKGMDPPTAPDPGRQATASALSGLQGSNFDRQYLQQQLSEHQMAIALYEAQASNGSDPQVRAFASRWLPSLRTHAEHIRSTMPTVAAR